jgi:hypothetical protein
VADGQLQTAGVNGKDFTLESAQAKLDVLA